MTTAKDDFVPADAPQPVGVAASASNAQDDFVPMDNGAPVGKTASPALVAARQAMNETPKDQRWDVGFGSGIAHGVQGISDLAVRLAHSAGSHSLDQLREDIRRGPFQVTDEGDKATNEDPTASRARFEAGLLPYVIGGQPAYAGSKAAISAIPWLGKAVNSTKLGSAIVNGGVSGAAMANAGDPAHAGTETSANGALWGAGIPAAAGAIGATGGKLIDAVSPAYQRAADVLSKYGIPMNLAQATGKFQWLNKFFNDNAASHGVMDDARGNMLRKYTGHVMGAAGETGDTLDVKGMLDRIGRGLDSVTQRGALDLNAVSPTLGTSIDSELAGLQAEAARHSINPNFGIANIKALRDAAAVNGGTIPGNILQDVKSSLRGERDGLGQKIDDVLRRHFTSQTLGSPIGAEWEALNQEYRNAMLLQRAATNNMEGLARPAAVSAGLKNQFNKGRNSLNSTDPVVETTRAMDQIKDPYMNSGTTHRGSLQETIKDLAHKVSAPLIGSAAGAGYSAYRGEDPKEGAEMGALGMLGGMGLVNGGARLFSNPSFVNYLTRGPQGMTSPLGRLAGTAYSNAARFPSYAVLSAPGAVTGLSGALSQAHKPQDDSYQY